MQIYLSMEWFLTVFFYINIAPDDLPTMSSLDSWINGERYQAFPKISGGNINDVAEMGKILVIVAIDENDKEKEKTNSR